MKHRYIDDDDMLKDGQTGRVPLMLRDAMTPLQRALAQESLASGRHKAFERAGITTGNRVAIVDAFGNGGLALHRPGARYAAPHPHTVDHAEQVAWQHTRAEAYDEYRRRICDAWKSPGHEIEVKPITGDARADAYAAADAAAAEAWRGPRNSGKWTIGSEQ
jgi:hypothetical protein